MSVSTSKYSLPDPLPGGQRPLPLLCAGAHALIGDNCDIGDGCSIGPGTVLDAECSMGRACQLFANVSPGHGVQLGKRVMIHPGVVIGADGCGIAFATDHWEKVPQLGSVVIGDDCEVGANCCIDRGAVGDTHPGMATQLDPAPQAQPIGAQNPRV